jgi:chromosome segregation ATPase
LFYAYSINAELTKFRHADAAKLKSTLEGMKKGHAIAMDGLNEQLQKLLAKNATLERQLKDQENQGKKKDKKIADLRKAATDFEKRREGFNELLHHFQDNLLGTISSYNVKFFNFCYAVHDAFSFPLCSRFGAGRDGHH